MPSVVGSGKTVRVTISTRGIDSGEPAEVIVYKKADDSVLDTLQSKVKDNVIATDWTAKGPGAEDAEQGWHVYYKAKCKGLETKATVLFVYTDWVEVTSVDEADAALPDAAFRLTAGDEVRERHTGSSGVRKEEHLPPGDVRIEWLKPYHLLEWVDEDGPQRKAKVKLIPPARLVWPKAGQHKQWVNLPAADDRPDQGSRITLKLTADGGKAGQKLYVKLTPGEENSARNDPLPELVGGTTADWCPDGGIEVQLAKDDGEPDCEATVEVELGLAGGDTFTLAVGGTTDCDDEQVTITNWRRLYHQVTRSKDAKLQGLDAAREALAEVFIDYEQYKEVLLDPADDQIPAGSWIDGAEFGVGGKVLNVGRHNRDWFKGKFDDQKTPLGAHLVIADKYYDGGPAGSFYTQTIEAVVQAQGHVFTIKDPGDYDVFARAVQDGESSLISGTWTSKAPSGHPDAGRSGDVTAAMVSINHAASRDKVKLTLQGITPGDGTPPKGKAASDAETKHPVKVKLKLHVARGPLLGNSAGPHQIITLTPTAPALFSAIAVHELGHSIRQVCKEVAPGLAEADHGRTYTGHGHRGAHCGHGLSDDEWARDSYKGLVASAGCVMFGASSATKPIPNDGKFCARCLPFVRADHCQSLHPAGGDAEESEAAEDAATVASPTIAITSINGGQGDHFAPGGDVLEVAYRIEGLAAEAVRVEVTSAGYGRNNPIFRRELEADEKTDGEHAFSYDGRVTATAGDLAGRRLSPLFSPYKLKIYKDASIIAEAEFKVLYHSIEVRMGHHVPDEQLPPPDGATRARYVQARLNELGYDAGPVDGKAQSATTQGALRRFQRASYKVGTQDLLRVTGRVDDDTVAALQAAQPRETWQQPLDPLRGDAKFYVHDDFMNDRGAADAAWYDDKLLADFNSGDRRRAERQMERAFIPLEVLIKVKGRDGSGHHATECSGAVPVAWEAVDPPEDDTVIDVDAARAVTQAANPAIQIPTPGWNPDAKAYVADARQFGTSKKRSSRIDATGSNCLESLGGFRAARARDNVKRWFPDDAGSRLQPYRVHGYGRETRGGTEHHRALVKAWDHPTDFPLRRGRAGVYLRMSTKAGDNVRVRAALTFEGLPNKAALEAAHQDVLPALAVELPTWTVWRRTRFSAWCQQVPPPATMWDGTPFDRGGVANQPDWAAIRDAYKHAFIEVENGGRPLEVVDYAATITEAVFKAAIARMPAKHRPPGVTVAAGGVVNGVTFSPRHMWGAAPFRAQRPAESMADYVRAFRSAMTAWSDRMAPAILREVYDRVRRRSPEGFVVLDFSAFDDPVNPLTVNRPDGTTATLAFLSYRGWVVRDGAVLTNVHNTSDITNYVIHECGHARLLYHHKGVDEVPAGHSATPKEHSQDRCAMSYTLGGDTMPETKYPYCGKCILRLRGWGVTTLPAAYG
ncbi:MAG: peptidoglycan-binding protein [Planctomycetes bacterium]|nr:peptidoglycan-binding protein [Planctomycetota bacterium]